MPKQQTDVSRNTLSLLPDNKSVKTLLRAASMRLQGKRLSRVRRSIGSVLLFDFGRLTKFRRQGQQRVFGEWHLLVDMASWTVLKGRTVLLTSENSPNRIDQQIPSLLNRRTVKRLVIHQTGNLDVTFGDRTKLKVKKRSKRKYHTNWILFYKDCWSLSCADKIDDFQVQLNV